MRTTVTATIRIGHGHDMHVHTVRHHDINLRAAYVHVLADALISVLAIAGLSAAWAFGWNFMDPLVGLVGAVVIASWALGLLRAAGRVLLDTVPDPKLETHSRPDRDRWRPGVRSARLAGGARAPCGDRIGGFRTPQAPAAYKQRLDGIVGLRMSPSK